MDKKLPLQCPSCSTKLSVMSLKCEACETVVTGSFKLPLLAKLSNDDQIFILEFLKSSGSIKEMASQAKVSYPTMRNRLDDLISTIKQLEKI
jgi:hypothetical protein